MKAFTVSIVATTMMALTALAGFAARPTTKVNVSESKFVLADVIPKQFGEWRELTGQQSQVVNPQTQQLLDKLYSQILTRTYVNSSGYRVMLSLAYGDDQRGSLAAHMPEVCYPAQGFVLSANEASPVVTPFGAIAARRLDTHMGQRYEPVTYWFAVGDQAIANKFQQRIVQIRMGLTGQIPDGLLFRVSSIDGAPRNAYRVQDEFVSALLKSVDDRARQKLSGLTSSGAAS